MSGKALAALRTGGASARRCDAGFQVLAYRYLGLSALAQTQPLRAPCGARRVLADNAQQPERSPSQIIEFRHSSFSLKPRSISITSKEVVMKIKPVLAALCGARAPAPAAAASAAK
jgi:hypothetical protein